MYALQFMKAEFAEVFVSIATSTFTSPSTSNTTFTFTSTFLSTSFFISTSNFYRYLYCPLYIGPFSDALDWSFSISTFTSKIEYPLFSFL